MQHALNLTARGIATFPMTSAKTPLSGSHGVKDASTDPGRLAELFSDRRAELVAIATGKPSGISVLDIDRQHDGLTWWQENRDRLPATFAYRTRSGGLHLWFRHHPELRTTPIGAIGTGIEIRSTGASAIYWPATGLPVLCDAPPAVWPDWLMPPPKPASQGPATLTPRGDDAPSRRYALGALRRGIERIAAAGPGQRNNALNAEAYSLIRLTEGGALDHAEIAEALAHAAHAAGLDRREIEQTLRSALTARGGRP
jgi:hypothetical protein